MKAKDKEVYFVAYRTEKSQEWETSGLVLYNEFDAKWEAKQMAAATGAETTIFKFENMRELNND